MDLTTRLWRITGLCLSAIFVLSILIHTNTSLDQDLGRHIKNGEIIWQTKIVPKTNLFSFTYPNFPFVNHHWGSEVVFYLLYKHFGILSITYFKIIMIFLAVLTIFYTSLKISNLPISIISLTIFLPLLSSRTDERPEIFGLLFFSLFLAIFIKYRQENYTGRAIWLLPFVQLLWTNTHITFIYGFLLIFLFIIDSIVNMNWRVAQNADSKHHGPRGKAFSYGEASVSWLHVREAVFKQTSKLLMVLILSIVLSLINPNGLSGLLYPLSVFRNYGYTIVENQNLFYLSRITSNIFIKIFWIQATILLITTLIFLFLGLKQKTIKTDICYLLLVTCFSILSIIMLRNFPFFVFTSIICFSYSINNILNQQKVWHQTFVYFTIPINIIFIYLVISNTFYNTFDINKKFEIKLATSYQKAVDFFIKNQLPGPIFNNFDIGGYLDYRLCSKTSQLAGVDAGGPPSADFSEQWGKAETGPANGCVFVDNRPEAYPAAFFEEYKNAQLYPELMNALIKKYKINSIIFAHTDATDWGTNFVRIIDKLKDFKLVYTDPNAFILTKSPFPISPISPLHPISPSSSKDYRDLLNLARFYNLLNKNGLAFNALEKAYNLNPQSCITRLNYGSILTQQDNLFLRNKGLEILKSTWYCPFPKNK